MTTDAAASSWRSLARLLGALLRTLESLAFIARSLHPPRFAEVLAAVGRPDDDLRAELEGLAAWGADLDWARAPSTRAANEALAAFDALREADDLRAVFRALRYPPRALEALYPLAGLLPPVSRFFLDPDRRDDETLIGRLAAPRPDGAGIFHVGDGPGSRGGFSVYVPEDFDPARSMPLVMALHGGAGTGRAFLWSWLASARGAGALLVAPTALGETWSLTGEDVDSPNLERILAWVGARWPVDPTRRLLTGMSDGGTFAYVSGLEPGSPFTHLAPVCATFHPILAQMADPDRLRGLPVHIVHGALDWMFPVETAREAAVALGAAGARVTYEEIETLSHTYPREANPAILTALNQPKGGADV